MPPNPLIHSATRNRRERLPPLREREQGGGRPNTPISPHYGAEKRRSRGHQLVRASFEQRPNSLQMVAGSSPVHLEEKSHWEVYNDLALMYDREMIREWENSLSLTLVFSALFSGVLTAFIIASIDLLVDELPTANAILETISHQISNSSTIPYTWRQKSPHPPEWTIIVNACFFIGFGCTLLTALISVLCIQWIRDFDKGLAFIANPAERALKRQFRLERMKKWHIPTIIGILPTLLVIALILSMVGVMFWLRGISLTVTIIAATILVLSGGFYLLTALFAAIYPSAPFTSPISRLFELTFLVLIRSFQSMSKRYSQGGTTREEWASKPFVASDANLLSGHRHREDEAIQSDYQLPSTSLLWLLSHIDVTFDRIQRLEEVLKALLNVDSPESVLDSYGKYKVPWSKILAFLSAQIEDVELERPSFDPRTLAKLEVLAQVAGTVGVQSYSETLCEVFSSPPTMLPDFQSSPIGTYIRFVRWGWGIPMLCDQSAPLQLLKDLARGSIQASPAFTLAWLSELRERLVQKSASREFVLEVLVELCISQASHSLPFFTQKAPGAYHIDVLRHVTITTIMVLVPAISRRNLARAKVEPLDELLGTLVSWYEFSIAAEAQMRGSDTLMKHLIHGLLLEVSSSSMDVQMRTMRKIRHSVIRALVHASPQPICGLEVKRESITTDHHLQYVEEGLRSLEQGGVRWGDEIANLVFGYMRTTKKKGTHYNLRERIFTVEVLLTVAYLVSEDKSRKKDKLEQGAVLAGWDQQHPWSVVLDALSSLSSAMNSPTSAFMHSSGIGSYILPILGKWVERERTDDLVEQVDRIEDRTMRWYAYQLLGWEYEDVLPEPQDEYWESSSWRQAMFEWSMFPLRSRVSDSSVLVALAQRADRSHDLVILNYFSTRSSEQKPDATDYGGDQVFASLQLLSTALSVFPLVPHLTISALEFVSKLIEFQDGMRYFIDYGGLDWLSMFPYDEPKVNNVEEEEERNVAVTFTTTDPFYALLTWLDKGYSEALDDRYLSIILRSRLVSNYRADREPRWFLSFIVRTINHLSRFSNATSSSKGTLVEFPEAAECCSRILSYQLALIGTSSTTAMIDPTQPSLSPVGYRSSSDRSWFIPSSGDDLTCGDFQTWQLFVHGLIRTLRGEKRITYSFYAVDREQHT